MSHTWIIAIEQENRALKQQCDELLAENEKLAEGERKCEGVFMVMSGCIDELRYKLEQSEQQHSELQAKYDELLAALITFVENSSIQTSFPFECEVAEAAIAKHRGQV